MLEKDSIRKRPLGRPRIIWEDVIKKYVKVVREGLDWKTQALDKEIGGKNIMTEQF